MSKKLIYVGDPMCSWCYGFIPEFNKALKFLGAEYQVEVVMGGLRPYAESPMDERTSRFLKKHWEEVAVASGQVFNYELLARKDFYYDTEIPSRAVLAMRELEPARELEFFQRIQYAFYAENRDTNLPTTYTYILDKMGVSDSRLFLDKFTSSSLKDKTRADFSKAREMGVSGFPTLLFQSGTEIKILCSGYAKAEQITAAIG